MITYVGWKVGQYVGSSKAPGGVSSSKGGRGKSFLAGGFNGGPGACKVFPLAIELPTFGESEEFGKARSPTSLGAGYQFEEEWLSIWGTTCTEGRVRSNGQQRSKYIVLLDQGYKIGLTTFTVSWGFHMWGLQKGRTEEKMWLGATHYMVDVMEET